MQMRQYFGLYGKCGSYFVVTHAFILQARMTNAVFKKKIENGRKDNHKSGWSRFELFLSFPSENGSFRPTRFPPRIH